MSARDEGAGDSKDEKRRRRSLYHQALTELTSGPGEHTNTPDNEEHGSALENRVSVEETNTAAEGYKSSPKGIDPEPQQAVQSVSKSPAPRQPRLILKYGTTPLASSGSTSSSPGFQWGRPSSIPGGTGSRVSSDSPNHPTPATQGASGRKTDRHSQSSGRATGEHSRLESVASTSSSQYDPECARSGSIPSFSPITSVPAPPGTIGLGIDRHLIQPSSETASHSRLGSVASTSSSWYDPERLKLHSIEHSPRSQERSTIWTDPITTPPSTKKPKYELKQPIYSERPLSSRRKPTNYEDDAVDDGPGPSGRLTPSTLTTDGSLAWTRALLPSGGNYDQSKEEDGNKAGSSRTVGEEASSDRVVVPSSSQETLPSPPYWKYLGRDDDFDPEGAKQFIMETLYPENLDVLCVTTILLRLPHHAIRSGVEEVIRSIRDWGKTVEEFLGTEPWSSLVVEMAFLMRDVTTLASVYCFPSSRADLYWRRFAYCFKKAHPPAKRAAMCKTQGHEQTYCRRLAQYFWEYRRSAMKGAHKRNGKARARATEETSIRVQREFLAYDLQCRDLIFRCKHDIWTGPWVHDERHGRSISRFLELLEKLPAYIYAQNHGYDCLSDGVIELSNLEWESVQHLGARFRAQLLNLRPEELIDDVLGDLITHGRQVWQAHERGGSYETAGYDNWYVCKGGPGLGLAQNMIDSTLDETASGKDIEM